MNPTLHAQILTIKKYQAWRTGEDTRTMGEAGIVPAAITSALDAVIAIAENHLRDGMKKAEPVNHAIRIYNSGYMAGHQDTVEGCFTDILSADMATYHEDVVSELVDDLRGRQPAEPVKDSFRFCAIGDSNYAAGMLTGWNLCVDGNEEKFNHIRGERLRAAVQASRSSNLNDPVPQPQQQAGDPVAWLCTPDFEGEQFLATTQGAADTLEKDGWSVQPLYDAPQPQQQTSKHVKDRRIDDVVRGLKASVAVGSDGQWVSVRREARDAAINRLQELNSDCAHMYESYVEAAAGPAPHPQQIPEGYKLAPIEPTPKMKTAGIGVEVYQESKPEIGALTWAEAKEIYKAMLEAAPEPEAKP